MSKYKDLIQKAKKPESQVTKKTDNQIKEQPENQKAKEPEVNLCIKVPKSLRQHWSAEAKRQGTTLKAVISEALKEKFGMPE